MLNVRTHSRGGKVGATLPAARGFSLLEVMLAISICTVTLVLLSGSMLSMMEARRVADMKAQAALMLASIVEEVSATPLSELAQYRPVLRNTPECRYEARVHVYGADGATLGLPISGGALPAGLPNPLRFQVSVSGTTVGGHTTALSADGYQVR